MHFKLRCFIVLLMLASPPPQVVEPAADDLPYLSVCPDPPLKYINLTRPFVVSQCKCMCQEQK